MPTDVGIGKEPKVNLSEGKVIKRVNGSVVKEYLPSGVEYDGDKIEAIYHAEGRAIPMNDLLKKDFTKSKTVTSPNTKKMNLKNKSGTVVSESEVLIKARGKNAEVNKIK